VLGADELLEVVVADLQFLRDDWDSSVDDHSLRRSSPVLRRLLVDNELQRAWKAAGFEKEPSIVASTLEPLARRLSTQKVRFASAGGASYGGVELRGALMVGYAMSEEEFKSLHADGVPEKEYGLRAFIESTCIIVDGLEVPRRVLIKYIANKLGGAHFNKRRRDDSGEERVYKRLDIAAEQVVLAGKNAVYFELLSIGQALVQAPDIIKLAESLE